MRIAGIRRPICTPLDNGSAASIICHHPSAFGTTGRP
jgi:hypothetical protein